MSDYDLEVYVYEGKAGEIVRESAQHLIVDDGVRVLPEKLCLRHMRLRKANFPDGLTRIGNWAFFSCKNLLEVNIPSTVQVIGKNAFEFCRQLKKIEFEDRNARSPHQLRTIDKEAFSVSISLQRIRLPPSVSVVGEKSFQHCLTLTEANLSSTCIIEIPYSAFAQCKSLQTISLPSTLEQIGGCAFWNCWELVTVILPIDSKQIRIHRKCFYDCGALANIALPKGSMAEDFENFEESPLRGCTLLHARFGYETTSIVAGLVSRFDAYPIHRLCYYHTRITVQELRQCVSDHQDGKSFLDKFGMSPLHVFFSTPEPSVELLEVLLESLPYQLIQRKDANDKRSLDYLVANWTDANALLFQTTVHKWVIGPLVRWGALSWMEAMQRHVQKILTEDDKERRAIFSDELLTNFEHITNVEATSILELALWKGKVKAGLIDDGISKRQALDRDECRCLNGSDIVVPNVCKFLDIAPQASSQED